MNEFLFGPGIVLVALFAAAGYTIYTFIKASHLERMAKIEKGIDTITPSNSNRCLELKLGTLMVNIALQFIKREKRTDEVVREYSIAEHERTAFNNAIGQLQREDLQKLKKKYLKKYLQKKPGFYNCTTSITKALRRLKR